MERFDCVVVGAGVVGLAVAERLSRDGRSVLCLERHERHGVETSSRNSEVVHSGLYYARGSLKAKLCLEGNRRLFEFCERRGVFIRRTGKLIVAVSKEELPKLESLERQARLNGVEGVRPAGKAELGKAPAMRCEGALWVPSTGIVDSEGLMGALLEDAEKNGAVFLWGAGLTAVERAQGGYVLRLSNGESAHARCVVNSAGLSCDAVAALAGLDVDAAGYRLHWFKGEYFSLRRKQAVDTLVYPVPEKHGLGVHLTLDAHGGQRLGPNAFPASSLDYSIDQTHRARFFESARRYLPDLREDDLMPGTAGIRPKLAADGTFRDFVVQEESARGLPGWVNLMGIESPGLTSSLPLADAVAGLLA